MLHVNINLSAEIKCPKLKVSNGLSHASGYSIGDYAIFKCYSEKYSNKGRKYRLICLADGTWSGMIPQCGHISDQYHFKDNIIHNDAKYD